MKRKVLIVEDEPSMGRGLKDNLEFEGYDVDLAENGAIGLKSEYPVCRVDIHLYRRAHSIGRELSLPMATI